MSKNKRYTFTLPEGSLLQRLLEQEITKTGGATTPLARKALCHYLNLRLEFADVLYVQPEDGINGEPQRYHDPASGARFLQEQFDHICSIKDEKTARELVKIGGMQRWF